MIKIRLKRCGRKGTPYYRIVLIDSRTKRDGKYIESLGWYQPRRKIDKFCLKQNRILMRLKEGAKPTKTISNFLVKKKLLPTPPKKQN